MKIYILISAILSISSAYSASESFFGFPNKENQSSSEYNSNDSIPREITEMNKRDTENALWVADAFPQRYNAEKNGEVIPHFSEREELAYQSFKKKMNMTERVLRSF